VGRRFDPDRAHGLPFRIEESGGSAVMLSEQNLDFLVAERLYRGFSGALYKRIHPQLERILWKRSRSSKNSFKILEIGAGSGEHFKYVKRRFSNYSMLDISNFGLRKIQTILEADSRCEFVLGSAECLPFKSENFDYIVATCVLAHLERPEVALQEIRRALKSQGTASLFVSADPSIFLRMMRKFIVSRKMSDLPISYEIYNNIAHRNPVHQLLHVINRVFKEDELKVIYYPFRLPIWNLSTHVIVHLRKN
jgi:phosphatidylethanolamine/phosphatidyl-N-methylethanolamine N-methyltransferase